MKKTLQIFNGFAFGSTVFINYLSNTGLLNNTTIGEISDNYKSLFTPAGYTFAIWGIIYLLLLVFSIYQGRSLFVKVTNDDFVLKTGWWFVLSCTFNSLWVFAWIYGYTGLSCILIFLLLFSLLKIIDNNRVALENTRFPVNAFFWWPFAIYSGWVVVASIANMSTFLEKINWSGFGFSDETWTLIMIVIAILLNSVVLWKRNMYGFAIVGSWALVGIGQANTGSYETITLIANIGAVILLILCVILGLRNSRKGE